VRSAETQGLRTEHGARRRISSGGAAEDGRGGLTAAGTATSAAANGLRRHSSPTPPRAPRVNASPEPFSNVVASLLEDLGVVGLVSFAVFHPAGAAAVAAVVLAVGIALFALLASRIRRGWHRRRDARLQRSTRLTAQVHP
jgi:Domain of unknown function (DUF4126)